MGKTEVRGHIQELRVEGKRIQYRPRRHTYILKNGEERESRHSTGRALLRQTLSKTLAGILRHRLK